ncbi:MAG TPA: restriction endonuclease [Phycisphaerae bacterium]|nr:restriction endonuclease [Phycisphaerae bacterium]
MAQYIFHTLSPADFEELCRDLLAADLALRLQSFLPGPDGGIDLLHASHDGDTVVQCKHYRKSGYQALMRVMEKEERAKIERLAPKRYILCTSVGLTKANKDALVRALSPYVRNSNDIIGLDDLNALLRDHPDVEKRTYKLWLTSAALLERILRNGLAVWNDMERAEIERKLCLYVNTDAFDRARQILHKYHYVIISGIPGIGKTTLAQVLVAHFLDRDYELVAAREDVQQAIDGFDANRRQVIYYDDFLGRSSFADRLGKNEEHGLLRLFTEVRDSSNKRAVMTTREYILQEARARYELLSGPELDIAKCIVAVESYTKARRARILYNHLFFSHLPEEYVHALVATRLYRRIIAHENYSPRVVEWMTTAFGTAEASASDYPQLFLQHLDNPTRVWCHAFDTQIASDARRLLLILATMPENTDITDLERAWRAAAGEGVSTGAGEAHLQFTSAIRQLDGSFVQTRRLARDTGVAFHNASVRDFVLQRIGADGTLPRELLVKAIYFEQIVTLVQLGHDGKPQQNATGLIPDDELLRTAVDRTIRSSQPQLVRVYSRHGELVSYRHPSASIGERLSRAARWVSALAGNELLKQLVDLALRLEEEGALPGNDPVAVAGFCDILMEAADVEDEKRTRVVGLMAGYIDRALDESGSASDWTVWGKFVDRHKSELRSLDWSELQDRVLTFCDSEADYVVERADSSGEIISERDDLETMADVWGLDIDEILQRMEDAAEERGLREPDYDGDPYGDLPRSTAPSGDSNEEIDRLFLSLGGSAE